MSVRLLLKATKPLRTNESYMSNNDDTVKGDYCK